MKITPEQFEIFKREAEEFYKSIGSVFCPYFREKINFNTRGLDHLKFKTWNKTRSQEDQYIRFRLLKLAPEVIKSSSTLQGLSRSKQFERKKINSRWEYMMTEVSYYEFVAILNDLRVKVIVKQLLGGEKYFWSIYPFWRVGKDNSKRLLYGGNPETD